MGELDDLEEIEIGPSVHPAKRFKTRESRLRALKGYQHRKAANLEKAKEGSRKLGFYRRGKLNPVKR
jgi:hypothetical protein